MTKSTPKVQLTLTDSIISLYTPDTRFLCSLTCLPCGLPGPRRTARHGHGGRRELLPAATLLPCAAAWQPSRTASSAAFNGLLPCTESSLWVGCVVVKPSLYPTYHSIITGACQEPAELLERLRLTCAFEIRAERGAPLLLQVKEGGGLGPAPARPGPPRLDASAFQQLRYPVPGRV